MSIQAPIAGTSRTRVWAIIRHVFDEFSNDRIPSVAASITFFFLLALFPAIACVASIYGLFADRGTIANELRLVSSFLPEGAVSVLRTDFMRLAAMPAERFNIGFITALTLAIWSASGGIKALIEGLNIAYATRETRSFFRLTLHALMLTVIAVMFGAVLIAFAVTLPPIVERLPPDNWFAVSCRILVWPLAFAACSVMSQLIYRYGPNRAHTKWRWITWGSTIASAAWMTGTFLFSWYVAKFGHYNEMYGSLGSIVGFLTWIWLSLLVLLLGAEINAAIEQADWT